MILGLSCRGLMEFTTGKKEQKGGLTIMDKPSLFRRAPSPCCYSYRFLHGFPALYLRFDISVRYGAVRVGAKVMVGGG